MDIAGQAAVVTGGASGLGAATAKALAEGGAKVTLFDLNAALGAETAKALGGTFAACDVADEASAVAAFAAARERMDPSVSSSTAPASPPPSAPPRAARRTRSTHSRRWCGST
jgi:NAD(P)-dependent dehydrogenase (short-subunit alcohol dehydrogenase family)